MGHWLLHQVSRLRRRVLRSTGRWLLRPFYAQLGDGYFDHSMWVRPEELIGPRPAYKLDPTHPKRGRPRLQRRVPIGCDRCGRCKTTTHGRSGDGQSACSVVDEKLSFTIVFVIVTHFKKGMNKTFISLLINVLSMLEVDHFIIWWEPLLGTTFTCLFFIVNSYT